MANDGRARPRRSEANRDVETEATAETERAGDMAETEQTDAVAVPDSADGKPDGPKGSNGEGET
jgi:hypothetical protein